MIPLELEAEILRLYKVEKWRPGTIADQLGVHHDVVHRVLMQDGLPRARIVRKAKIDKYIPFIQETWRKYPKLSSTALWRMARSRGYPGKERNFRHMAAPFRVKPKAEAYLRLKTLPGEQAQADWGHFGTIEIGKAKRSLMAFVIVLSWSREIFLRFYLGQQSENFLRGHIAAFERWGGTPRIVLYDNLKSAVIERMGSAIRFNPLILEFANRYGFEPRPVAVARGNEKGRVERAIRYIRGSFFMARKWVNLDDLNAQADAWCTGEARERRWPEDDGRQVGDAFAEEKSHLFRLPDSPFPADERREAAVGKTPYVRFDGNDYSVPHEFVRTIVMILASLDTVRIVHDGTVIATHQRCFDRRRQVEQPGHIARLQAEKHAARRSRGLNRLCAAVPIAETIMKRLAEQGANLGNATMQLLRMLDIYGQARFEQAIQEALTRQVPHPAAVQQILERNHRAEGLAPTLAITLPDDPRVRDITVIPHDLGSYDRLSNINSERKQEDDQDDTCCAAAR